MKKYLIVLKKELLDCVRDKRSILMMLLPLLIFPTLLTFYNYQIKSADESLSSKIVLTTDTKNEIKDVINAIDLTGTNVEIIESEDATSILKSGRASLFINKSKNGYRLIYDQNSIKSVKTLNIVTSVIESQKTSRLYQILNLHGESTDILSEYDYQFEDISDQSENKMNSMISILGPMLIVMFIATGGCSIAVDMFCGEKERGSLESLLSTQVERTSLYAAKVTAVFIFVCASSFISIAGYIISFIISNGEIEFSFSATQMFLLILIAGIFALFTTSIICALSLSSKTVKEGSLRINIFTLIPTIIGGISMYMESGSTPLSITFVPIVNIIHALKAILSDTVNITQVSITVFSTLFYGIIFLLIGYKSINSEKALY